MASFERYNNLVKIQLEQNIENTDLFVVISSVSEPILSHIRSVFGEL